MKTQNKKISMILVGAFLFPYCGRADDLKQHFEAYETEGTAAAQWVASAGEGAVGLALTLYGYKGARKTAALASLILKQDHWAKNSLIYEPIMNSVDEYESARENVARLGKDVTKTQRTSAPYDHNVIQLEAAERRFERAKQNLEKVTEDAIKYDPKFAELRSIARSGDEIVISSLKPVEKAANAVERMRAAETGFTAGNVLSRTAGIILLIDSIYRVRVLSNELNPGVFPLGKVVTDAASSD